MTTVDLTANKNTQVLSSKEKESIEVSIHLETPVRDKRSRNMGVGQRGGKRGKMAQGRKGGGGNM
jgi:hypothetical protein